MLVNEVVDPEKILCEHCKCLIRKGDLVSIVATNKQFEEARENSKTKSYDALVSTGTDDSKVYLYHIKCFESVSGL